MSPNSVICGIGLLNADEQQDYAAISSGIGCKKVIGTISAIDGV